MNRRDLVLAGVGAVAVAALRAEGVEPAPAGTPARSPLIDAAFACLQVGEACQQHCLALLGKSDTSLAECATTVAAMLPMCRALAELAVQESPHLKALAAVCARVCRDCEKACRKHESHHAICKQCAESCAVCAAQCEKVQA